MPVRQSPIDRAVARGRTTVADLCRELENARIACGLGYADLGRAVGISGQQAARICRGGSPDVSIVRLAALLAAVGLDLSARAYPGGPPVRDRAHLALLGRLRQELPGSLTWRVEVPVVGDGPNGLGGSPTWTDRRAWDARIEGSGWRIGVEAETRLGDVQALERRIALKERDGGIGVVLLLVNDTAHNRRILRDLSPGLRPRFPGSTRIALARLRLGQAPTSSTVIVL